MNIILLSFLFSALATLVKSQFSSPFPVHSIDHSSRRSKGKYFNFFNADIDAILGRKDWDGEVFPVMVERKSGLVKTEVKIWRNRNGGSVGDGHGRRDESAEVDDWMVGDMIMFYEGDEWRSYDHSIGNEAWYYAMGSYCDKPVIESWKKSKGLLDGPSPTKKFEILKVVRTPDEYLSSYIGFDHANSRILIAVRGSANRDNWINVNADFNPMKYPNAPTLKDPKVFSGFYDAWKDLEAAGLGNEIVRAFEQSEYKDVFLTGHSMGAAVAGIAAMDLRLSPLYKDLPIGRVDVVTFGSPRWCNKEMAQLFNKIIDSNWRIVNRYDTVVTVPIKKMGYYHVGTEIWYRWQRWWWNEDPISYKICDGSGEDPNCFGTNYWPDKVDLSTKHHTTYFSLSKDKLCGKGRRRLLRDENESNRLLDMHH